MADSTATLEAFERYTALIEGQLDTGLVGRHGATFAPEAETANTIQVERGELFPIALCGGEPSGDPEVLSSRLERLIAVSRAPETIGRVAVVDRSGHHRPLYRPILVYAWLQAFRLLYESVAQSQFGRWEEATRAWADLLEAELTSTGWDGTTTLGSRGEVAADLCWTALALQAAGKVFVRDAWIDLASDLFGKLTRAQQSSGAFLAAGASDNPEALWYHELAILHAAASYAVQAEDRGVAAAVQRSTQWHQNETQPDHASSHPYGVFAFIWNPQTRMHADGMLHAVRAQHPGGVGGISAILLADALYCMRLFQKLETGD